MCERGDQSAKERKKKRKDELVTAVSRLAERRSARGFKKRGPPAFVNEKGSQCTYEGKGTISREKRKKKNINQGVACVDSRKKGTQTHIIGVALAFASERGPCAPKKRGTVRGKDIKKKENLTVRCTLLWHNCYCWGEKSGRRGQTRQSHE